MNIKNPFQEEHSFPQLSPLIDVLFLLLVFFMLTTTFEKALKEISNINVDLPLSKKTGEPIIKDQTIVVAITQEGTYEVEGIPCDASELLERIQQHISENKQAVLIAGDKKAPFQAVVNVYDVMQVLGIRQFSHEVRQRP